MESTFFYHYASVACAIILPALGVGIGQGITSMAAIKAMDNQPSARDEIFGTFLTGMMLIETAAILSLVIGLKLLFFGNSAGLPTYEYIHYSELGIAFAIGLTGCIAGITSSFPAQEACLATARQPFFNNKIQVILLLTQTLLQSPIAFGFLIALLIQSQLPHVATLTDSLRLVGSGLAIGLGSIGPAIGLSLLGKQACQSVGYNKATYPKIISFTIISAALIESSIILSLVISFFLLQLSSPTENPFQGVILLSAGLAIGLGTLGVGISSGHLASKACKVIGLKPELYGTISNVSILSQILIESAAIYALLIALYLVFG